MPARMNLVGRGMRKKCDAKFYCFMKSIKSILFLLMAYFVCSCKHAAKLSSLDVLGPSPADSFGVGCFFYEDSGEQKNAPLLFASDFESIAYVAINGSAVEFRLEKETSIKVDDSTANFIDEYKSKDFDLKVEMNMKRDHPTDETYYEGTIIVKDKQGNKISKKTAGECGC